VSGSAAKPSAEASGAAQAIPDADRQLTLDRDELKYAIPAHRLGAFVRALRAHLRPHRFTGEGANLLPEAQHFTTTVYFDTPSRALLRAAATEPERNVKLRVREYYDVHSSLAELATDPAQIVRHQPWVFLELKQRTGTRTFKHRLRVERAELAAFFQAPDATASVPNPGAGPRPDGWAEERAAILLFRASLAEPLAPSCVANYRRLALEDESGRLRVTLDVELGCYAAPGDLWTRRGPLTRESLGPPCAAAPTCLLEVKLRDATPAWLAHALEQAQAKRERISKFVLASEAVHGRA
jgi:hypothetical protein